MLVVDRPRRVAYGSWASDARQAMTDNPDYFVWWYSAKSIGLALVFGAFCYQLGKNSTPRRSSL